MYILSKLWNSEVKTSHNINLLNEYFDMQGLGYILDIKYAQENWKACLTLGNQIQRFPEWEFTNCSYIFIFHADLVFEE